MINFQHISPSLADADLNEVESRFDFHFPEDVRAHYLKHNGGHPDKKRYVNSDGSTRVVHDFIPIKQSSIRTSKTLEVTLQWLKIDEPLIPVHLVPFADDPFGNFYCFSTRDEDHGAIYWVNMEGMRGRQPQYLERSLDEFLEKLS